MRGPNRTSEVASGDCWIDSFRCGNSNGCLVSDPAAGAPIKEGTLNEGALDEHIPHGLRKTFQERVGADNLIRRSYATNSYSWTRPPSRSDLRSRFGSGHAIGAGGGPSGDACSSERWGRWLL